MSFDVIVVGSANMDLVATTPSLPRPGETVLGHAFSTVPGGKGANQAVAAARAGARTAFIGAVGEDAFGGSLRAALIDADVDVDRLRTVPGASGVALIAVDDAGENNIIVVSGANATVSALDEGDRAAIGAAAVLLCQLEIPLDAVLSAARAAREAGARVVLNAAPARALPDELLSLVDMLVVNEGEAAVLAGADEDAGADALLDALLARVPHALITLGGRGSAYANRDGGRVAVPAPSVPVVDTTGAGDCFAGAFATAWAEGRAIGEAVRWASAAGAVAVQRPGATSSLPTRDEIDELYAATYP